MKYYVSVRMYANLEDEFTGEPMKKINNVLNKYINEDSLYLFKAIWKKRAVVSFQIADVDIMEELEDEIIEVSKYVSILFNISNYIADDLYDMILTDYKQISNGEVIGYGSISSERISSERELFSALANL